MKFFTDRTVKNDWLLIKVSQYIKLRNPNRWKEILIDPGVYDLTKSNSYSWEGSIDIKEFLYGIPKNHYFTCDYPGDMLNFRKDIGNHEKAILSDKFVLKSWENAIKYSGHPQYITTVQFKHNDYYDFTQWFDKYNSLYCKDGSQYMGLGNMCRQLYLNEFMKHSLDYAFKHCNFPKIHIYGLGMRSIPYAYKLSKRFNIELTVDSTKWTRPCTVELKEKCGQFFKHQYRQEVFDAYMIELEKRGVIIDRETRISRSEE